MSGTGAHRRKKGEEESDSCHKNRLIWVERLEGARVSIKACSEILGSKSGL